MAELDDDLDNELDDDLDDDPYGLLRDPFLGFRQSVCAGILMFGLVIGAGIPISHPSWKTVLVAAFALPSVGFAAPGIFVKDKRRSVRLFLWGISLFAVAVGLVTLFKVVWPPWYP